MIVEKQLQKIIQNPNGITLSNGGTVYYDGDRQYIVWEEQSIGPKNKNK